MTKIKQDKLFPKIQTILRQKLVKRKPFSKKDGFFITRKKEEIMLTQYKIYCLLARPPPFSVQMV